MESNTNAYFQVTIVHHYVLGWMSTTDYAIFFIEYSKSLYEIFEYFVAKPTNEYSLSISRRMTHMQMRELMNKLNGKMSATDDHCAQFYTKIIHKRDIDINYLEFLSESCSSSSNVEDELMQLYRGKFMLV